jgi:flagella basal body P-ring formation protein FlgA
MKRTVTAAVVLAATLGAGVLLVGDDPPVVRVFLPREVTVDGAPLRLGRLCVVHCADRALSARAAAVAMGRAPQADETIVVDRRTIASRLAASGIAADRVRLLGAVEVTVRREATVFPAAAVAEAARKLLAARAPAPAGSRYQPTRTVEDLVLGPVAGATLSARLGQGAPRGYVKVLVSAVAEGRPLRTVEVWYRIRYPRRRALATETIPAGAELTRANVKVEVTPDGIREQAEWVEPFGQVALVAIAKGASIRPAMIAPKRPPVRIKKGQTAMFVLNGRGFQIVTQVEALADGRVGETIKLRNVDTRRVVSGTVAADGTLRPLFAFGKGTP